MGGLLGGSQRVCWPPLKLLLEGDSFYAYDGRKLRFTATIKPTKTILSTVMH